MKHFDGFMHGVNLGGWYSQCNHTEDRYDNFIKEADFKTISEWGLDHIRLPIDYNLVEKADGTRIEKGFERIQQAIDWCKKYHLNMILDLHKTAGFSFDAGENENGFFDNPDYQERFYKLWETFAEKYAKSYDGTVYPNGAHGEICFELLNEVTAQSYCKKWNEIARTCIERIRKIAPSIKILVGSYWNNSLASVKDLDPPYDENIVYNFHTYDPLLFTHQGAKWVGQNMDPAFRFPLKSKFSEYEVKTQEMVGQIGITFKQFPQDATVDETYFETIFAEAIEIAEKRNVLLYCGEYGVIDRATSEDTVEWFRLISKTFNKHGIGRAAWSFRKMDFGLSDERLDDIRPTLLKYL